MGSKNKNSKKKSKPRAARRLHAQELHDQQPHDAVLERCLAQFAAHGASIATATHSLGARRIEV